MKHLFLIGALAICGTTFAQQNINSRSGELASPVVNADGSVTFNIKAPEAAHVIVNGDWEADNGHCTLVKGADGVWSATTVALPSDMYTYRVSIDGYTTTDSANPYLYRDVANNYNYFFVPGELADYFQVHDVPHGTVTATWYHSAATNADRRITIYTPAGYEQSATRYPVLYLLHGSGGDETAWLQSGRVVRILDNLIAQGKVQPMIVVMPNGVISTTAAPGETDINLDFRPRLTNQIPGAYKNGIFELSFPEIVNFIDTRYRTVAEKSARAVAGLSMGGFHAMFISANYPEMFDYVGLFSAGVNFSNVDMTLPAYVNLDAKLATQAEQGVKYYLVACGVADVLYPSNCAITARMKAAGLDYHWHESSRGHSWSNWRKYLIEFTTHLFK